MTDPHLLDGAKLHGVRSVIRKMLLTYDSLRKPTRIFLYFADTCVGSDFERLAGSPGRDSIFCKSLWQPGRRLVESLGVYTRTGSGRVRGSGTSWSLQPCGEFDMQ